MEPAAWSSETGTPGVPHKQEDREGKKASNNLLMGMYQNDDSGPIEMPESGQDLSNLYCEKRSHPHDEKEKRFKDSKT